MSKNIGDQGEEQSVSSLEGSVTLMTHNSISIEFYMSYK